MRRLTGTLKLRRDRQETVGGGGVAASPEMADSLVTGGRDQSRPEEGFLSL